MFVNKEGVSRIHGVISEQCKLLDNARTPDKSWASCPGAIHDHPQGKCVAIMFNSVKMYFNL